MKRFIFLFLIFCSVSYAQDFPRMVSLNGNEVNIRSGPGLKYPIQWVFKQNDLPIEIVARYKNWYKLVDWEGAEGWVFKPLTKAKRRFLVIMDKTSLYFDSDDTSQIVAILGRGKAGQVAQCNEEFCNVIVRDNSRNVYYGWVKEKDIWGACTSKDTALACRN